MVKSKENLVGAYAFLIGVVLAVIFGLFNKPLEQAGGLFYSALVVIGLIVGFMNVGDKDSSTFLMAQTIGLLISLKHGQQQKAIHNIREQIEKQGKKVYIFESNDINISELENFPQIQMWVNTACFGLARDDIRIINLSDILKFLKSGK